MNSLNSYSINILMKNNQAIIKYFLLLIMFVSIQVKSQNPVYCFTSAEGYGSNVTGGGKATPIIVSTYNDLKTQLQSSGSKVILVSGTIVIPSGGEITGTISNKTLLGLPGAHLVNNNQTASTSGILYLGSGSDNVIIRNIIFEGPGAYDVDGNDNLSCMATDFWLDHCEFQDGMDGNCDITKTANFGTVSWCKFTYLKPPKPGGSGGNDDHRLSGLVGSSGSSYPASGHYQITFQCNYWASGCVERMPRARNADLHILNCYYNTAGTGIYAIGVGGGVKNSTVYVEGCDFADVASVFRSFDTTDGGSESVTFTNCLKGVASVGSEVPKPSYSYTSFPVEDVASTVGNATYGAGATLNITQAGVISSNYQSTGTSQLMDDSGINIFPTLVSKMLYISIKKSEKVNADITITSLSGQKLISTTKMINSGETVELNLNSLASGIYFCSIRSLDEMTTLKFFKN